MVCLTEGACVDVTDMEVIDGQLADFAVDGNEIAPRLGRPGDPVTVDPATAAIRAAYRSVTGGDALRIYVEVSSNADATFELSNAVYVDSDGNLTPVDRETSIGAVDGSARVPTTVALDFPECRPRWRVAVPGVPPRRHRPARRRPPGGADRRRAGSDKHGVLKLGECGELGRVEREVGGAWRGRVADAGHGQRV